MKATYIYRIFALLLFVIIYNSSTAQNNKIVKATAINSAEISQIQKEPVTVIENKVTKTYLVKNEEYYTSFIHSLEGKKEYISNIPELKLKAEGEGWFIRINSEIEKAKLERSKLVGNEK